MGRALIAMELDEHIGSSIAALRGIAGELGLEGRTPEPAA
jgi:hypothetical protein